jgi:hypothetical protein
MQRRDILKTKATGLAAGAGGVAAKARTFVLVHGAWHGGWCWSRVADRLRAGGHQVFTPTQTGLGERKRLSPVQIRLMRRLKARASGPRHSRDGAGAEIATGHGAMVMAPEELARVLIGVTS